MFVNRTLNIDFMDFISIIHTDWKSHPQLPWSTRMTFSVGQLLPLPVPECQTTRKLLRRPPPSLEGQRQHPRPHSKMWGRGDFIVPSVGRLLEQKKAKQKSLPPPKRTGAINKKPCHVWLWWNYRHRNTVNTHHNSSYHPRAHDIPKVVSDSVCLSITSFKCQDLGSSLSAVAGEELDAQRPLLSSAKLQFEQRFAST